MDSRSKPERDKLQPEEEAVVNIEAEVAVIEEEVEEAEEVPMERTEEEVVVEAEEVPMVIDKDQEPLLLQDSMLMETQSSKKSTNHTKESQDKKELIHSIESPVPEEEESQKTRRVDTEDSTMEIKSTSLTRRRELKAKKKLRKRLSQLRLESHPQKWKSLDTLLMKLWLDLPSLRRRMPERPKVSKEPRPKLMITKKNINLPSNKTLMLKIPLP